MKSRTNRLAIAVVALATAAALGGCTAGAGAEQSQGSGTTTLKFWSWNDMSAATEAWNKANPHIKVEFEKLASEQDYFSKVSAAVTSGKNAPDVVQVDYTNLPSNVVAGLVQDISKYTGDVKKSFSAANWNQVEVGSGVYGIPQDTAPLVLYYRKDIFEQDGLSAPKTWAEYEKAAAVIKANQPNSYISSFASNGAAWFAALCQQSGAQWYKVNASSWSVNIDDPKCKAVADYWQGMLDKQYVKGDQNWQPAWFKRFADGTYVSWIGPAWGTAALKTNAPDLSGKWAVAQLPSWKAGENTSAFWGGSALAVTKSSANAADAVKFITWLNTSSQAQKLLNNELGIFPSAKNGSSLRAFTSPDPYFSGQKLGPIFAAASSGKASQWTWGPTETDTEGALNDGFASAINGTTKLDDVLEKAQQQTVAAMKQKGLKVK